MASRDANGVAAHTAFELHTNLCSHVGQHATPQLSPSEEGHENSTPDGSTRLQEKRNCVSVIIGLMRNRTFQALHHTMKRSV